MAYGVLPAPGSTYGPCEGECHHIDCAHLREMAETICHLCNEPIGYGVAFQEDEQDRLVHYECNLRTLDARPNRKTYTLADGTELIRTDYGDRPSWTAVFPDGEIADFPAFDNPDNGKQMLAYVRRKRAELADDDLTKGES